MATVAEVDMSQSPTLQDIPAIVGKGIDNYRRALVPATAMAFVVLAVFGVARVIAQRFVDDGNLLAAFVIDFAGLSLASVIALPWFRLALQVERGKPAAMPSPSSLEWGSMVVATLFFWGGVMLGIRYMVGIPSIFVLIWYGLFGYAVATGVGPGLRALGTSVRLGQGRRWTVALLALVLAFMNLLGLLPIGAGVNPVTVTATIVLLAITTNVSMGAGAHLFDWLAISEKR